MDRGDYLPALYLVGRAPERLDLAGGPGKRKRVFYFFLPDKIIRRYAAAGLFSDL